MKKNFLLKILFLVLCVAFQNASYAQIEKLKPLKDKDMAGTLIPVEKKGMWGYAIKAENGKKPKVVIKEIFEEAREFADGVAIVKYNGKFGLLKRSGVMMINPMYDEFEDFHSGITHVKKDGVIYKITTDATEICRWGALDNGVLSFTYKNVNFRMHPITAGQFNMGGGGKYIELDYDSPKHEVNITKTFYIGETEVTQALWQVVMGHSPSVSTGETLPIEYVTWDDCCEFTKKISEIFEVEFRLPTEAEWEYAARGGSDNEEYSGSNRIEDVGWCSKNSTSVQNVATKSPNGNGLYDMSGNVAEWCSDWYNSNYYKDCPYNDPMGATSGKGRIVRGGSWKQHSVFARVSCRTSHAPTYKSNDIGMRLALSQPKQLTE